MPASDYLALFSLSPHKDNLQPIITSAPLGWIAPVISQKWVNISSVAVGIFAGAYLGRYIPFNVASVFLVVTPLALILAPYSWSHDFLLLLPLTFLGLDKLIESYSERVAFNCWIGWLLLSLLTVSQLLLKSQFGSKSGWMA